MKPAPKKKVIPKPEEPKTEPEAIEPIVEKPEENGTSTEDESEENES